ncbi:sensor histidine kinase [Spirochaeta lutea]|uniref:histidine kinase n=1 Tax=Spirochaeta lutea TaxID=1480694 RepID=A0A098QUY9_9SPIO|nr:sensor histidine kinase [Spirochaeta lutea]KGE71228.1 hypothetical protein DC28_12285 [Spirochaeta lutea]
MKPWFFVVALAVLFGHGLGALYLLLLAETVELHPVLLYAPLLSGGVSLFGIVLALILRYRINLQILQRFNLSRADAASGKTSSPGILDLVCTPPESLAIRGLERLQDDFNARMNHQVLAHQEYTAVQARLIHDLKQPLSTLSLGLSNLPPEFKQPLEQELIRAIQKSDQALFALRSRSLHEDFLIRPVNPEHLVRAAIRRRVKECIPKSIRVTFSQFLDGLDFAETEELNSPQLPGCLVDAKWFSFMVDQVLINAVKYSPPGQPIGVEIRYSRNADTAGITVRNTAPNLTTSDLPRLGRWGYTGWADRTTSERLSEGAKQEMDHHDAGVPQSSGIGLYLLKRMAKAMNIGVTMTLESPQIFRLTLELPLDGGFYGVHGPAPTSR